MTNSEYEKIVLTEEELKEAILEGKKKKYFREKHGYYWEQQEKKPKKPYTFPTNTPEIKGI